MIQFFQVIFLIAAIILIVLNIGEYNRWQDGRKEGSQRHYPIKWVNFILTTVVALGCVINVIVQWVGGS